jgi:hypothetical protein
MSGAADNQSILCTDYFTEEQVLRMKHYLDNSPTLAAMQLETVKNPTSVPSVPSGNIIVQDGEEFEVDSPLEMLPGTSITVEAGGTLLISSTITGACGQMWQGIIVEGNTGLTHSATDLEGQGYVRGFSTGKIEHARCAISVHGMDTNGEPVPGTGGGYVKLSLTTLENNTTGVRYGPFQHANKSHLLAVNFTTTDNYRGSDEQIKYLDLTDVIRLNVDACKFKDLRSTCTIAKLPIGIDAKSAGFKAASCEFDNLRIGVKAEGVGPSKGSFAVSSGEFTSCYIGIYSNNCSSYRISGNNFILKKPSSCPSTSASIIGTVLQGNSAGFTYRKNDFAYDSATQPDELLIGTYCRGTGEGLNNFITKNTYTNLAFANLASGVNGSQDDGLIYTCNTNIDCFNDFTVEGGGLIRRVQRDFGTAGVLLPTGNIFTYNGLNSFINEGSKTIDYYYYDGDDYQDPAETGEVEGINPISTFTSNSNCGYAEPCPFPCNPNEVGAWAQEFYTDRSERQTRNANLVYITDSLEMGAALDTIQYLKRMMDKNASLILQNLSLDTMDVETDSIVAWLIRSESYPADLRLVDHYFFTGKFEEFDTLWAAIPNKYALEDYQEGELDELELIYGAIRSHLQSGGRLDKLPQAIIDSLLFWADWCSAPGFLVHGLLWRNGIETEPDCSKGLGSRSENANKKTDTVKNGQNRFTLYPNPADQFLNIHFSTEQKDIDAIVYNLQGRMLFRRHFASAKSVGVSTTLLSSGIYILEVRTAGAVVGHDKFVVAR